MSDVIAFDPATRKQAAAMGWSRFHNRELSCCGQIEAAEFVAALKPGGPPLPAGLRPGGVKLSVAVERPRWFPNRRDIDANDILDLSVMVGRIEAAYLICGAEVELVPPRDWKGTVRYDISNRRVLAALYPQEKALVPRKPRATKEPYDHNILDAIGLGLWKVGRF